MNAEHSHHHHHAPSAGSGQSTSRLFLALSLTLGYAGVEAAAGWWAGSLALLADAGHMLTDAAALGLAALAAWWSRRAPSPRFSYGMARTEVLAGLLNAVLMLTVITGISVAAVNRLLSPTLVQGEAVTVVAAIGLGINLLVLWLLAHGEKNLNTRAAALHVLGDVLGSVAALLAGVIIMYTGWTPIDPILSLLIVALIVTSTLSLLREALVALLEGVPRHLDLTTVGRAMAGVEGTLSVHDLHIWSLSSERPALSAHVVLRSYADWAAVLQRQQHLLAERFEIHHVTLQPEVNEAPLHWQGEHGTSAA